MRLSRIQAITHVALEAPAGLGDELRWFYSEVAGLDEVFADGTARGQLCFKSAQIELRVQFVDKPRIHPIARRLTVSVPSLNDAAERLDERAVAYRWLNGLLFTDRRLSVHDPAGHHVELKQWWPEAPL